MLIAQCPMLNAQRIAAMALGIELSALSFPSFR
jgi:hypothetical protein